jgi:hypothetical protein
MLMETYSGEITWGFSSLSLNFNWSSAWNEFIGDKVPDVNMMDLGIKAWISLKAIPALKHQKASFLWYLFSAIKLLPPFLLRWLALNVI